MRILLIRHAEPDYDKDSLTEKGFREAGYLGERAAAWKGKVDEVYVSPLGRAQATSVPVLNALEKEAHTLDWLQEFRGRINEGYGTFEGIPWDFRPSFWTGQQALYDKDRWYRQAPMEKTGELPSVEEVYLETCRGLDELLSSYGYCREGGVYRVNRHRDQTIVLVCHMGITFIMLSHLLGIPFVPLMQGFFLAPSSVSVVSTEEVEPGIAAFRCQCLGDVAHLRKHGEPISQMGYFAEIFQE